MLHTLIAFASLMDHLAFAFLCLVFFKETSGIRPSKMSTTSFSSFSDAAEALNRKVHDMNKRVGKRAGGGVTDGV